MNLFEEIEFVWGHFAALFGGWFQTLTRKQPKISSIHSSPTKYNPTWPLQFPLHPWHCGKAICPIPKGSETPSTKGFTVLTPHRHSFRGVRYTHCNPRMLLRRPLLSLPTSSHCQHWGGHDTFYQESTDPQVESSEANAGTLPQIESPQIER